ncbi:MAG TPA: hypothetical protein VJU02_01480 [Nitrospiraceae bacterium]|nr:hypothetical protein [Nitrospiraceae bacterium]
MQTHGLQLDYEAVHEVVHRSLSEYYEDADKAMPTDIELGDEAHKLTSVFLDFAESFLPQATDHDDDKEEA